MKDPTLLPTLSTLLLAVVSAGLIVVAIPVHATVQAPATTARS
jgi:hypothetical protein